jgi:Xaa-Pro aminopeptidase
MSLSALFADRRAPTIFDAARALLQREGIGEVRVSRWFPAAGVSALRAGRIEVSVVDGALVPERECKTPREVKLLMESQRTAARAMRRALERIRAAEIGADGVLREGRRRLCSEAVREDIERTAAECGGLCVDTIVAGGVQAANPHEQGSGPLRAGEAIVLDIFPRDRHSGYWGDLTRTVVRGRPSQKLQSIYRAVWRAQRAAIDAVRAGVDAAEPDRAARRVFESLGFESRQSSRGPVGFIHTTGHGVGLDIHESPSLREGGGTLRAGHVVTVEPGWYDPDIGGVRIEDVVRVTSRGGVVFPAPGRRFELD